MLVNLSRIGYKNGSFILATKARQVIYIEDPSDGWWSIVFTPPPRDVEDQYNDDKLRDTILYCLGMPKARVDIEFRNDLDFNICMSWLWR